MKEFDFIRQIKLLSNNLWENSIGNDCALFGENYLVTKDLLVENVHFYSAMPLRALAYKALAVNCSDIFADGGIPRFILLGIAAPKKWAVKLEAFYKYLFEYAQSWNITIIGGDTVKSKELVISVTCIGQAIGKPWLRKNANPGDYIYLTGQIGASAFGLSKIKKLGFEEKDSDIKTHLYPPFRLKTVQHLGDQVHAGIDLSDGFIADLRKLLEESQTGAVLQISEIPFAKSIPKARQKKYGFYGGEDYELLLCAKEPINIEQYKGVTGESIYLIGRINEKKGCIELQNNKKNSIFINQKQKEGYDHWL